MNYLAEKLIASVLCVVLGLTALTSDDRPLSDQPAGTIALGATMFSSR